MVSTSGGGIGERRSSSVSDPTGAQATDVRRRRIYLAVAEAEKQLEAAYGALEKVLGGPPVGSTGAAGTWLTETELAESRSYASKREAEGLGSGS